MKKFLKTLLLVFFLCILYVYTLVIEQIPKQITIFEGKKISMKTLIRQLFLRIGILSIYSYISI